MPTNSTTPPTAKVILGCSKCGSSLPDVAQFCLKCGEPVSSPQETPAVVEAPHPTAPPTGRRRRVVRWVLLAILGGGVLWVSISAGPVAQGVRELLGDKPDRVIVDSAFSVGPHTFRYYKFSLPVGSANVAAVGQFRSAAQSPAAAADVDNGIEAYVLSESAFTAWQKGYATGSLYDSGKVTESSVNAEIPAGAGIYYLVFSNKDAPQTAKSIHATVVLRYKSWLHCTLISHNCAQ